MNPDDVVNALRQLMIDNNADPAIVNSIDFKRLIVDNWDKIREEVKLDVKKRNVFGRIERLIVMIVLMNVPTMTRPFISRFNEIMMEMGYQAYQSKPDRARHHIENQRRNESDYNEVMREYSIPADSAPDRDNSYHPEPSSPSVMFTNQERGTSPLKRDYSLPFIEYLPDTLLRSFDAGRSNDGKTSDTPQKRVAPSVITSHMSSPNPLQLWNSSPSISPSGSSFSLSCPDSLNHVNPSTGEQQGNTRRLGSRDQLEFSTAMNREEADKYVFPEKTDAQLGSDDSLSTSNEFNPPSSHSMKDDAFVLDNYRNNYSWDYNLPL